MEHQTNEREQNLSRSFGRTNSRGSSQGRRSVSLAHIVPLQIDDKIESESVSEAGDIGDRALHSHRHSESSSIILSIDNGLWSHGPTASNTTYPVSPLPGEIMSPISTGVIVGPKENKQEKEKSFSLPPLLEYMSCLVYLAFFGILGVLTRYLLQKFFGPGIAGVTGEHHFVYLDLPSNMVGSFLMGWWGVVFKGDISKVSDHLAIGLTTGYLGSLTTFSGWNQKMLELAVDGQWVFCLVGFLSGLFLPAYCIKYGIVTAKNFKLLLRNKRATSSTWRVDSCNRHMAVMAVLVLMLGGLWSVSGILIEKDFNSNPDDAQLWVACIVAAPGVWVRWFLARLNGRGLGKAGLLKWLPFGTLIANVSAACVMAALSTLKKVVHTKTCDTISTGMQFGFLGCLSTVSTFIAEYNAMEEGQKSWRASAYALLTILQSFGLGILIYSVPVWTNGYR